MKINKQNKEKEEGRILSAWVLKRSLCIVGSVWERLGGYQLGSASPHQVRLGHILEDGGATGDGVSDF